MTYPAGTELAAHIEVFADTLPLEPRALARAEANSRREFTQLAGVNYRITGHTEHQSVLPSESGVVVVRYTAVVT